MSLIRSTTRVHHKQFVLFNLPLSLGHAATASISPSVPLRLLFPARASVPSPRGASGRSGAFSGTSGISGTTTVASASTSFTPASSSTAASVCFGFGFCFERFQRGELRLNRLVVLD